MDEVTNKPASPSAAAPCSPSPDGVRENITHAVLIKQAAKWLQRKCAIVITDMSHGGSETPDAIGWRGTHSILVECKASVSDYRADAKKFFRRYPERGMGAMRYFCAMRGMLKPDRLPEHWGLLEWDGKKMWETKRSAPFHENNARAEISVLLSAMRRIAKTAPEGVSVKCYTIPTKRRATLGIAAENAPTQP